MRHAVHSLQRIGPLQEMFHRPCMAPQRECPYASEKYQQDGESNMKELKGRTAVVTGAASGMGLAIVSRLIVDLEVRTGTLGIVRLKDLPLRRPLRRQWLRSRTPGPAAATPVQSTLF